MAGTGLEAKVAECLAVAERAGVAAPEVNSAVAAMAAEAAARAA